jgi:hypothetical protein
MAILNGPLMSLDASGSVANALTFSKWKGRNYVRQLVVPANPKTVKQVSVRAMMKFLSQAWAAIGATPKGTWVAPAAADSVSPFNAYIQRNLKRWASFQSPSQTYPSPNTGTVGTLAAQSIIAGVRQLTVQCSLTAVNTNWLLLIHRSQSIGFTPSFSTLVKAVIKTTTPAEQFVDTPLLPGLYYYRLVPCTTEGVMGAAFAEISGTAT